VACATGKKARKNHEIQNFIVEEATAGIYLTRCNISYIVPSQYKAYSWNNPLAYIRDRRWILIFDIFKRITCWELGKSGGDGATTAESEGATATGIHLIQSEYTTPNHVSYSLYEDSKNNSKSK
jgi:hypothetical protein